MEESLECNQDLRGRARADSLDGRIVCHRGVLVCGQCGNHWDGLGFDDRNLRLYGFVGGGHVSGCG